MHANPAERSGSLTVLSATGPAADSEAPAGAHRSCPAAGAPGSAGRCWGCCSGDGAGAGCIGGGSAGCAAAAVPGAPAAATGTGPGPKASWCEPCPSPAGSTPDGCPTSMPCAAPRAQGTLLCSCKTGAARRPGGRRHLSYAIDIQVSSLQFAQNCNLARACLQRTAAGVQAKL